MSRKQVYGKRSRAIYDPFQAFVSPQRPAPEKNIREQGIFVAEVVKELSRLKVEDKKSENGSRRGRKVLGEKSANEAVDAVKKVVESGKTRRKGRKVAEQDEDAENTGDSKGEDGGRQSPRRRPRRTLEERIPEQKPSQPNQAFVADNVPLFLDGHGYETEDEQLARPNDSSVPSHPQLRPKEASTDSSAPSISILPPTPPAEDDIYTTHCSDLLHLSSHGITNFTEWSNQLSNHFAITKIAEASFAEVYRLSLLEDLSAFDTADESVLKVIALKPPEDSLPPVEKKKERVAALKKAEAMSKVADVANEVKLLQRMASIPGFTNFRDVRVIQGRPPQSFIKAFRDFNTEQKARGKEASIFPDPAKKGSYGDEQLWAVIEMQDAGTDLERLVERGSMRGIWGVWDVFWQVVLALGKGEEGAEFEHRDLHMGNICVRGGDAAREGEIDVKRKLHFTGLETTVIDYTLSRALLSSKTPPAKAESDQEIAYHDLAHPSNASIFEGDSTEEYQYDIYRYMRGCVVAGDAYWNPSALTSSTDVSERKEGVEAADSPWRAHNPKTNLLWLHYALHTLLDQLDWPSATKAPSKKKNSGADHAKWKRANDLEHALLRVQDLLDPGVLCGAEGLASAGALVGLALEEGWLDVGDLDGDEEGDAVGGEGEEGLEGLNVSDEGRVVGEGETLLDTEARVSPREEGEEQSKRGGRTTRRR